MQTIVLIILYYCTSIMNWRRLIMINCIIRGYFRNIVAMFKITKFFWKTSSSKETVKTLAKLYQLIAARNIVINVNSPEPQEIPELFNWAMHSRKNITRPLPTVLQRNSSHASLFTSMRPEDFDSTVIFLKTKPSLFVSQQLWHNRCVGVDLSKIISLSPKRSNYH